MEFMEITSILPDDVLEEILVRLPVKHLLRWKCVCKHWYSLIGDYDFAKKHYHFQYVMHGADNDAGPLFLDSPSQVSKPAEFYLLSKDGGVMNGVIGLQWGRTRLALWNPATREFKDVARWPVIPDNKAAEQFGGEIHGFVFYQQSNDFKILGQINFDIGDDVSTIYEFHLYSLKSNSWKRIEKGPSGRPNLLYSDRDACLNNGVYYWLKYRDVWSFQNLILSFDFKSENFKEFDSPKAYVCRNNQHTFDERVWCGCKIDLRIGKYKEGLALFVTRTLENADCSFELWAVTKFRKDDHGVPLSWELVIIVESIHPFNWSLSVKAFRAFGDLLVMIQRGNSFEDEEACLYDPSTHTYNNLGLAFCSCYKYVESLFSLSR